MSRSIIILAMLTLLQSSPAWSDEASDMKAAALKSCENPVVFMTGYKKVEAIDKCKCIVVKTDYAIVIAGDKAKIKENADKSTFECALKSAM